MLDPYDSGEVVIAGIGVAAVAFALAVIYVVGVEILNNIWVVLGMAAALLIAAIAVKIMSDKKPGRPQF
jgi:hypothetical protein